MSREQAKVARLNQHYGIRSQLAFPTQAKCNRSGRERSRILSYQKKFLADLFDSWSFELKN
jgi:hypothetical protein